MRWNNIPIPEAHLGGLIVGALLQLFLSHKLFQLPWIGYSIGFPLLIAGIGLCAWAVIAANKIDIESPGRLLTSGPYALSRNPMYLGWTLIYIGIAFAANAFWIIVFLPLVVLYIHLIDISKEEQILEEQFGDDYRQYKKRVRRYF